MKKYLMIVFLSAYILNGKAQDTTIITQEIAKEDEKQYNKMLKYFLKDRNEVNHLWKLNLINSSVITPCIAFEQRLSKKLSLYIGLNNHLEREYGLNYSSYYSGSVPIQLRYYHNIDKRNLKGKNTTGFSANYFSLGVTNYFNNTHFIPIDNDDLLFHGGSKYYGHGHLVSIDLWYGIQRRIGNIGYVDISTGFGFGKVFNGPPEPYYIIIPGIKLELGFAVESLIFWKK